MRITIHRGTKQIGGCITEIATANSRIFIDFGQVLPDALREAYLPPPAIAGVTIGKPDCDGIFFTHYHGDHVGLYPAILPGIPLYIGDVSKRILREYYLRTDPSQALSIDRFQTFREGQKISIGDMSITPYAVDHSAYDAYMFLIEGEGQRILHTGDFRDHGFRGKALLKMLKAYVGKVDVLITEGTSLSRENSQTITEGQIQQQAKQWMKQFARVFILCSSTHFDRIAAFYHARPPTRLFVCDAYQKSLLTTVAQAGRQRTSLYRFDYIYSYAPNLDDRMRKDGFCMLLRANQNSAELLNKFYQPQNSLIIYSMWKGYLQGETANPRILQLLDGLHYQYLHTSGHATKNTIRLVCDTVAPTCAIIPMHSSAPEQMESLRLPYPIRLLRDGEVFEIKKENKRW